NLAQEPWASKYGYQSDLPNTGPLSFMHLEYQRCLSSDASDINNTFDIAVLGMPFDTKTTYRPGARFGPFAVRAGSRRLLVNAYDFNYASSPYGLGARILDCGDVPISMFDPAKALDQMETAYTTLLQRPVRNGTGVNPGYKDRTEGLAKDAHAHPRIVTIGGDHTIVLPILRSLHEVYGPISVIHFDAHLDTWDPRLFGDTPEEEITHGTFFAIAAREGLMTNKSVHAGVRTKLFSPNDLAYDDQTVGFQVISAEDLDDYGMTKILEYVRKRVGDTPVYLSVDIDVIDPSMAPGTGTPEVGGWTTREVKRLIRGLAGLNIMQVSISS
ncbi:Putative agmatinase 3, partial [Leucoagaricus sp. SymC.cos]